MTVHVRMAAAAAVMIVACCRQGDPPPAAPRQQAETVSVAATAEYLELRFDGRTKDVIDTTTGASIARYVAVLDMPRRYLGGTGNVLVAGLGSGAVAAGYAKLGWRVTVAEPDARVAELARRRFTFLGAGITVDGRDARSLLEAEQAGFDVILIDVVGVPKAPAALLTKEFFALAARRLGERGILAVAVESPGWNGQVVHYLNTTLRTVFALTTVLPIAEPPNLFCSIVLVASRTARSDLLVDVDRNVTLDPDWRYGPEYQKTHAWDNHFSPAPARVPVQTDRDNRWEAIFADLDEFARKQESDYLP